MFWERVWGFVRRPQLGRQSRETKRGCVCTSGAVWVSFTRYQEGPEVLYLVMVSCPSQTNKKFPRILIIRIFIICAHSQSSLYTSTYFTLRYATSCGS